MNQSVNLDKVYKKTLADQTYDIIYNSIINGEIKPGEKLVEAQLAEMLQVSRTPIREALKRLRATDLVEGNSYSKMTVKKITPDEIIEIAELRTVLEIYTMKKAVDNCTDEDTAVLQKILDDSYIEIKANNYPRIISLNTAFHDKIISMSNSSTAIQMLASLRDILYRHRVVGVISGNNWRNYESHCKLLEAFKNRDKESAIEEIVSHMEYSKQSTLDGLMAGLEANSVHEVLNSNK